jgi:hypothetical protein
MPVFFSLLDDFLTDLNLYKKFIVWSHPLKVSKLIPPKPFYGAIFFKHLHVSSQKLSFYLAY